MSIENDKATRLAFDLDAKIRGVTHARDIDMRVIRILTVAFDAAERSAKEQYDRGVAEAHENCATLADDEHAFGLAARIRERVSA